MNVQDVHLGVSGVWSRNMVSDNHHCIVTANDEIIDSDLTLSQAEAKLCYYINMGEDYYIGDMRDFN